ncbi:MAG TPA: hypothetical protein VKB27_06855 [Gammaproteobacteria bacterium]|nr:hypothetical protein [Gammaproteobacteria bacterium]
MTKKKAPWGAFLVLAALIILFWAAISSSFWAWWPLFRTGRSKPQATPTCHHNLSRGRRSPGSTRALAVKFDIRGRASRVYTVFVAAAMSALPSSTAGPGLEHLE